MKKISQGPIQSYNANPYITIRARNRTLTEPCNTQGLAFKDLPALGKKDGNSNQQLPAARKSIKGYLMSTGIRV